MQSIFLYVKFNNNGFMLLYNVSIVWVFLNKTHKKKILYINIINLKKMLLFQIIEKIYIFFIFNIIYLQFLF